MAIGLGRLFGFEFAENFKHPYAAKSVTDFWRRWHISLSSWFRDYVYIPLGGNRAAAWRTYLNLLIVFALCGLWHGANFTFLAWGLYHGAWLILERLGLSRVMRKLPAVVGHAATLVIVLGGWVLFRADSFTQAGAFFTSMAGGHDGTIYGIDLLTPRLSVVLPIGLIAALPVLPWLRLQCTDVPKWLSWLRVPCEFAVAAMVMLVIDMCVAGGTFTAFIYFRF
jgi:alginate O-acetyltransferase complex protein AlgI